MTHDWNNIHLYGWTIYEYIIIYVTEHAYEYIWINMYADILMIVYILMNEIHVCFIYIYIYTYIYMNELCMHIYNYMWQLSIYESVKSRLIGKDSDAGKDWRQKEKGTAEDEMVR